MRLSRVSVTKYRSIDVQAKFDVGDFTVLIGPNNQGKSNLLRAAVLAMEIIEGWANLPAGLQKANLSPAMLLRAARLQQSRLKSGDHVGYEWERDFPIFARERHGAQKSTLIRLEFELSIEEQADFLTMTGIRTNQRLPVRVTISQNDKVTLSIPKQGQGQHFEKSKEIAQFISSKIALLHVPAVRPGTLALDVANDILRTKRRELSRTPAYRKALDEVRKFDEGAVDDVRSLLSDTLSRFIPGMTDVSLDARDHERAGALSDIRINDGVETSISAKGDGVQSLAALALTLEWTRSGSDPERHLIVAIEEPESHLHPEAVHEVRRVLRELSLSQQVIVTTHSPALINRADLASNVTVSDRTAIPATSIASLRSILGVKVSDSLAAADVVICCEGEHDAHALPAILGQRDPRVASWISDGRLIFDSAGSGSKIYQRVIAARDLMAEPLVVIDGDQAGRSDITKLLADGIIDDTRIVRISRPHCKHSELEDVIRMDVYLEAIEEIIGHPLSQRQARKLSMGHDDAWSERLEKLLDSVGHPTPQRTVQTCKLAVRDLTIERSALGEDVVIEGSGDLFDRIIHLIGKIMRGTN